ncbi:MAG: peptidoglycan DD-metalloendopeptidase family protein [Methylophilaceae bacterium]
MKRLFLISFLVIFLVGCASSMPAPVVNKSPQNNNKTPTSTSAKSASSDWRPDSYKVKRGDTLYSIGLEHGLDYREIAAANNLYEPFTINIGQRLSLASLKKKDAADDAKPTSYESEDGVIISPIDTGTAVTASTNVASEESVVTPVLTEPRATREPYSVEALNRKEPVKQATAITTLPDTPKVKPGSKVTPVIAGKSGWAWPTQGKVIGRFNQAKNKGIDISGKKGQAITASATGKVIYAGSGLRGYGKLVIIKHNKTFLSVYAHNSKIDVKEGQIVKAGQKIAAMGNTDTNSVKLHFEIRQQGKSVDPEKFLPQN